jgi:hypothetical protein
LRAFEARNPPRHGSVRGPDEVPPEEGGMVSDQDRSILRELAARVAQIAALPVQEETRRRWRALNGLRPERPMVMVDQVCWNELEADGELALHCADPECRQYEQRLRRRLYQWRHFRVDMVMDPFIHVAKAVHSTGFGIAVDEETIATDPHNSVVSHGYINQFVTDADLDKIRTPVVTHDAAESARRLAVARDLFRGTLEPRLEGVAPYLSVWDPLTTWMSIEDALFALVDRPAYMHELVRRMVHGHLAYLDQLEAQDLVCGPQSLIHCTGAWTDDLPQDAATPATYRQRWMFGLAQMLGAVSPAMYEEFEIEPCLPIFARFGLVYYGCCDPLHNKLTQVRRIPNVRKVSISPWAIEEDGAAAIGRDFVYSRKPNPAHLAAETFDEELVRRHLRTSIGICRRHGCPLELILKDLSTVRHDPPRLWRWATIAMEEVGAA